MTLETTILVVLASIAGGSIGGGAARAAIWRGAVIILLALLIAAVIGFIANGDIMIAGIAFIATAALTSVAMRLSAAQSIAVLVGAILFGVATMTLTETMMLRLH